MTSNQPQIDSDGFKQHMMHDISLLERARLQKLEMIAIMEAQAAKQEDDYLDKTLLRFGNVFNGWN